MLDLHARDVVARLRGPGAANPVGARRGSGISRNRITSIAWRGASGAGRQMEPVMGGGNSVSAIYSAHLDGQIRAWMPLMPGPDDVGETEELDEDEGQEAEAEGGGRCLQEPDGAADNLQVTSHSAT